MNVILFIVNESIKFYDQENTSGHYYLGYQETICFSRKFIINEILD